jgi:glycosyltransferase involved in cell wall biosynthesis
MRILAVSSYGELGGAELSLAAFAAHRPADVELRALLVSGGGLSELLLELGVPVWTGSGYEGRPTPARLARFTRRFDALMASWPPDVVWATGQKAALLCAPACRRRGVALAWHKVDFSWDRILARPLAAAATGVVAVSSAVTEALGPWQGRRPIYIVGPPVQLGEDVVSQPDPRHPCIGTLARLVPYKGHHFIIEAAARLSEEFPCLRTVLAGGEAAEYPGYRDELVSLARRRGLEDRVELPGFVRPVDRLLRDLTVFVNATYRDTEGFGLEGLSGAMLEASWAGVPVVATRGGGTAEGVLDGRTGTLVDRADPEELAAAIAPYLRDAELRQRTGHEARNFTHLRFAPAAVAERLYAALANISRVPGGSVGTLA